MSHLIIAEVCHMANKAYCEVWGDKSQPSWRDAPEWQRCSAKNGVEFILDLMEEGIDPTPESSHENWMKDKLAKGWKYGEIKDPEAKTHPCLVPFNELDGNQRFKDAIFCGIVKEMGKIYWPHLNKEQK